MRRGCSACSPGPFVGVPNAAMVIDVPLADVRPGQVFAADVRSPSDLLLVAHGQPVTPPLLLKIRSDWSGFAALTMVRVVQPAERVPEAGFGSEGRRTSAPPDEGACPM